jgi:diguanylate cyclase (GGDEF)-like protein
MERQSTTPAASSGEQAETIAELRREVDRLNDEVARLGDLLSRADSVVAKLAPGDGRRDAIMLRAFMDRSDLLAWLKDERGALVYANRNWLEAFARIARSHDLEVLGGHDLVRSIEYQTGPDGRARFWQVTRFPFHNGSGQRFVGGLAHDATERVHQDEEVRRLAITDQLTGLLNRRGFFMLAEPELQRARRRGASCALVFIDLDGLKRVNDRLGHQSGDAILQLAALILKKVFRETDIVARIGGDEFAAFATDTKGDIDAIQRRLDAAVQSLASNQILKAQLGFSIGLLDCEPSDTQTLDVLLAEADEKMYDNKRSKRGR